jgi:myotubularin-related protein 1/2
MLFRIRSDNPNVVVAWRLCEVNANYNVCLTYPSLMVVPTSISDEEVRQAAHFRSRGRLAHLCWQHPDNRAVLARSSQPFTGFGMTCSTADEKLVAAVCDTANPRRYSFESLFHSPSRKTESDSIL